MYLSCDHHFEFRFLAYIYFFIYLLISISALLHVYRSIQVKLVAEDNNPIFRNEFPPIKIYCYHLSQRWHPDNEYLRKLEYYPNSTEFQFYIEVEMHKELLLSPIITNNPEEADLFYIPVYIFAVKHTETFRNLNDLIEELRSIGPWYDRKKGSDHIICSGHDPAYNDSPFFSEFTKSQIIFCSPYPSREEIWDKWEMQRHIVLPFMSYFPDYPFEQTDWKRTRKNSIFVGFTLKTTKDDVNQFRSTILKYVKKVPRNDYLLFTRDEEDITNVMKVIPKYYSDSDFCVSTKGDLPTGKRLFDAIHFGCIPVIISDAVLLPLSGNYLNYSKFSIRIKENNIEQLPKIIQKFSQKQIAQMRSELYKAARAFRFRMGQPPRIGEGFWAISWMWYIRHLFKLQNDFRYYV